MSRFFGLEALIAFVKWLKIESCLHLKRPSFSDTGHQLRMCSRLEKLPHRSHLLVFLIPQRFRLSGVFNPFEQAFKANESTPLGTLCIMLCHVALSFSSIKSFAKSP